MLYLDTTEVIQPLSLRCRDCFVRDGIFHRVNLIVKIGGPRRGFPFCGCGGKTDRIVGDSVLKPSPPPFNSKSHKDTKTFKVTRPKVTRVYHVRNKNNQSSSPRKYQRLSRCPRNHNLQKRPIRISPLRTIHSIRSPRCTRPQRRNLRCHQARVPPSPT
jgi:hypothetical protein